MGISVYHNPDLSVTQIFSFCFRLQVDHLPPDYIPEVCLDDRSHNSKKWYFARHGFDGRKFITLTLSPRRNKFRASKKGKEHGTPARAVDDKGKKKGVNIDDNKCVSPVSKHASAEKVKNVPGLWQICCIITILAVLYLIWTTISNSFSKFLYN